MQVRHHDHHAEQQDDGVEINRPVRLVERERIHAHHEAGADDGRARPVYAEARQAADGEHQVGDREDENSRQSYAPKRLCQMEKTSKKATPSAATPRKLPKGSS